MAVRSALRAALAVIISINGWLDPSAIVRLEV
jgi:hypothetical protein